MDQEKRVRELQVLDAELKSLRKDAKVYQQAGSSGLFMRCDVAKAKEHVRKELLKHGDKGKDLATN